MSTDQDIINWIEILAKTRSSDALDSKKIGTAYQNLWNWLNPMGLSLFKRMFCWIKVGSDVEVTDIMQEIGRWIASGGPDGYLTYLEKAKSENKVPLSPKQYMAGRRSNLASFFRSIVSTGAFGDFPQQVLRKHVAMQKALQRSKIEGKIYEYILEGGKDGTQIWAREDCNSDIKRSWRFENRRFLIKQFALESPRVSIGSAELEAEQELLESRHYHFSGRLERPKILINIIFDSLGEIFPLRGTTFLSIAQSTVFHRSNQETTDLTTSIKEKQYISI